jgi:hypothetical protein
MQARSLQNCTEQLIQIMYDERTAIPAPTVDNSSANSPDAQRALDDWQSALDQRVQDRAATILTSDQQTRFEQFMIRQREARSAFASLNVAQTGDNPGGGASAKGYVAGDERLHEAQCQSLRLPADTAC